MIKNVWANKNSLTLTPSGLTRFVREFGKEQKMKHTKGFCILFYERFIYEGKFTFYATDMESVRNGVQTFLYALYFR